MATVPPRRVPDVHVMEDDHTVRMYFHCPIYTGGPVNSVDSYRQVTFVATSKDGIRFEANSEILGNSYFRVWRDGAFFYAIAMPGVLYRSRNGLTDFEEGPTLFSRSMRHSAVQKRGSTLYVFYSNKGDNPESILVSAIDVRGDWLEWTKSEPKRLLAPEESWEGANLPRVASTNGAAQGPVNQLRDPGLFVGEDRTYLLYSIAGEQGIAIAELVWN